MTEDVLLGICLGDITCAVFVNSHLGESSSRGVLLFICLFSLVMQPVPCMFTVKRSTRPLRPRLSDHKGFYLFGFFSS